MSQKFAFAIIYIFIFVFGSVIGSFLNVIIYRLPKKISFTKGRSHCPNCDRTLPFYEMIPVFSWFILRGKCRKCKAKISFRYPLVEMLTGILAVLCAWKFEFSLYALLVFFAMCILILISFVDLDTMEIPNGFILWLLVPGLFSFLFKEVVWYERIIGFFAISVPMFILALIVNGAFGGGDIKLMAVAGLLLGWKNALLATFIGVLFGGIYAIYLLLSKKANAKEHFAFGPFLCFGITLALLWGSELINLYLGMFNL